MVNIDSVLKSRDIILSTKVCIVKAMVFPVVMYRCESWTIKKTEHGKIDVFKLRCWKRLLSLPWAPRRSNKSIWKEINPEYSLEGWCWTWSSNTLSSNTLPPDVKSWLIGKDPDAGKDWRQEEKGATEDEMVGWHYQLNGHEFEQARGVGDGQGSLACCSPWGHRIRHNWTTTMVKLIAHIKTRIYHGFIARYFRIYILKIDFSCASFGKFLSCWMKSNYHMTLDFI